MVLYLWSRKDTSSNESRLRFDFESPFHEILHISNDGTEITLFFS